MTTHADPVNAARTAPRAASSGILLAEFTKTRSVRAPYWTLVTAALLSLVLGPVFVPWVLDAVPEQDWATEIDPVAVTYGGFHIAIVAFGAVGVLAATSEYASGMIRLTFAATPNRLRVLAAKATVVAAVTLPAGVAVSVATFQLGQLPLAAEGLDVALTDPGVPRAVVGAGLFAAACAVLGVAIGVLTRHAAGAVAVLVGVLFVPQLLIDILPASWDSAVGFIPHWAGFAVFTLRPGTTADNMLAPWPGFAMFSAYVAAVLVAAAVVLQRRDT